MKCPKCGNTNIKNGQKFCTKCGFKFDNSDKNAIKANWKPKSNETIYSQPIVDTTSVEGVNVVRGRAIWNIEKGEIARRITESELMAAESLKGVIVQEGCTALVYIDGSLMATLEAGAYTFPAKTDMERRIDEVQSEVDAEVARQRNLDEEQRKRDAEYANSFRSRGLFGRLAALGRGVMNILFGRKKGDSVEQNKKKSEERARKLEAIQQPKVCRVYIVSNRAIHLLFNGTETSDGQVQFEPLKVQTRLHDIDMAVTIQLQISNIHDFVTNYLADEGFLSAIRLQHLLAPMVQQTLNQTLRNVDYSDEGLPATVLDTLKSNLIQALNTMLHGIEVTSVLNITDRSADFDRFRSVSRELYASERELQFLQRTGEFRNRMEQEQNRQSIDRATNEEELRHALMNINKDHIVHDNEMDQFVMMIRAQKRLRDSEDLIDEAKIKNAEYEAFADLKKNMLVKEDDVAALENTLAQGRLSRENVTEIMRVQALQKLEVARQIAEFELGDSQMEHDMASELRKAQHLGNLLSAELNTKKLADIYNDERNEFEWNRAMNRRQQQSEIEWQEHLRQVQLNREIMEAERQQRVEDIKLQHEMNRQEKLDAMEILERKARLAQANMEAMRQADSREETLRMENELKRIEVESRMTQEQIAAAHMKEIADLDANAQAEMARMMGSGNSVKSEMLEQQNAQTKQLYEQMIALQKQNQSDMQAQANMTQQQMMQMMQLMMQGMSQSNAAQAAGVQQMNQQQMDLMKQRIEDQQQMKQEYRENMFHQQSRIDANQAQSLNYTAQVSSAALGSKQDNNSDENRCPKCGAKIPSVDIFCAECGTRIK